MPITLKLSLSSADPPLAQAASPQPGPSASKKPQGKPLPAPVRHGPSTPTIILKPSGTASTAKKREKRKLIEDDGFEESDVTGGADESQPVAGPSIIRLHIPKSTPAEPSTLGKTLPATTEATLLPSVYSDSPASSSVQVAPNALALPFPKEIGTPQSNENGEHPSPSTSIAATTPSTRSPKVKPKSKAKARSRVSTKPTAIPARLLPSNPSTPKPMPPPLSPSSAPGTPQSIPTITDEQIIKLEPLDDGDVDADPLSLPMSPSADGASTPKGEFGLPETPVTGRVGTGGAWKRIKKPLAELLNKFMAELRRRDEYDLFGRPVNLDDFPGYLDAIGDEDRMMDMATMQSKIDHNEYKSMDEVENDLRLLVTAAQTFNPPGTVPHTSAGKLLIHGMKHIERSRPLVLTPPPSPQYTSEAGTPFHGRETTALTENGVDRDSDLEPQQIIPEQMLWFPPNSLEALAVGWNLTGGRRQYAKRIIRGREKFVGKWRHFELDGTRDLAEMEDPDDMLRQWRTDDPPNRVKDWKGLRMDGEWWDFDLGGPLGQPPIPFTPYPRRRPIRKRNLNALDFGVLLQIETEAALLSQRSGFEDHDDVLAEHLRPARQRSKHAASNTFVNVYEQEVLPVDWLSEVCLGGTAGEAYTRSVESFIKGATDGARAWGTSDVPKSGEDGLLQTVRANWRGGVLSPPTSNISDTTLHRLRELRTCPPSSWDPSLLSVARRAYPRSAMRHLTSHLNPLDILPLLRKPTDFTYQGVAGRAGVPAGLQWAGNEIQRLARQVARKRAAEDVTNVAETKTEVVGKRKRSEQDQRKVGDERDGAHEEEQMAAKRSKPDGPAVKLERPTDSNASSPLTQAPDSPGPPVGPRPSLDEGKMTSGGPAVSSTTTVKPKVGVKAEKTAAGEPDGEQYEDEQALKRLRLELVSIAKFYPLSALRKMTRGEAERLLPVNVRNLMSPTE